ncbi:uncharacterized protein LOC109610862 [Ooceraea biroi]|uniref:uncharacterized protein LOC109610862 n=1 Tax=Ooceraea biroi TaxID=2015173 RepID=UPI000F08DA65|nr:uncharacterized protein LOC109610862 [Ooceraea biroi]
MCTRDWSRLKRSHVCPELSYSLCKLAINGHGTCSDIVRNLRGSHCRRSPSFVSLIGNTARLYHLYRQARLAL